MWRDAFPVCGVSESGVLSFVHGFETAVPCYLLRQGDALVCSIGELSGGDAGADEWFSFVGVEAKCTP